MLPHSGGPPPSPRQPRPFSDPALPKVPPSAEVGPSRAPLLTSLNTVLAGGSLGMMVSVVFLRFSGKARSIVVWTTGGSSWCPAVGGKQRQPSPGLWSQLQSLISTALTWARQTALALREKGCCFPWEAQKTSQLQPAGSIPRDGDLEQQQPVEKGRGQGPLLSARSRGPDPAPLCLPCHDLKTPP